ncbi:MAG: hypothetical protein ACTHOE_09330 [Conexibacter sp.]
MTPDEPRFPTNVLAAWLAGVADVASMAWLWTSNAPTWLKGVVSGVLFLGLWSITLYHAGRKRAWQDWRRRSDGLEPLRPQPVPEGQAEGDGRERRWSRRPLR